MSHTMQILDHLTSKPITAMDALNDYGCFRLAARINELRMNGHNIKTEIKNQDGKRYAMYHLLNTTKGETK